MAKNKKKVLLFIAEDDVENARRARVLKAGLAKIGFPCQIVNRLSNDLEELKLIAQYRVWELPRWIVLNKGKTEHDACIMPSYNDAVATLELLDKVK